MKTSASRSTPDYGMRQRYYEEGGNVHVTYSEDIETVLRVNHEQRAFRSRFDRKRDLHHVMRVPVSVLMQIGHETGLDFFQPDDAKAILKILKRPEYAPFRTYSGAI